MPLTEITPETLPFQWINARLNASLVEGQMRPILDFALIWNCFERECCKRKATPTSIKDAVTLRESRLQALAYAQLRLEFIARRRDCADTVEQYLDRLDGFRSEEKIKPVDRPLVADALDDTKNPALVPLVQGLLLTAHRVRNNLFHGNKDPLDLPHQTTLFRNVNALLMQFTDDYTRRQ